MVAQTVEAGAGERRTGLASPVMSRGRRNALKSHCPHGHPYSGDNLYIDPKGNRRCRQCRRDRRAELLGDESLRMPRVRKPKPVRGIHNRLKTHCPRGHPYEEDNLYIHPKGNRRCRECKHEARQRAGSKRRGPPNRRSPVGFITG